MDAAPTASSPASTSTPAASSVPATTTHEGTDGKACEQVAEVVALFLRFFFAALLIFGFLFTNVLLG